eukprot:TRINITY_DN3873_c0_g1_i1.p1 TRINITY_DN3873_c0_g1~~TRINITY_DN3873_c0_g1_i1.p1  ORF type:complete len:481 (-),score=72.54 TRINITY_DN3873_c0_g1_i1:39-1406(-)
MYKVCVFLLYCFVLCTALNIAIPSTPIDWSPVDKVLQDSIDAHIFPGAVAIVGTEKGILYQRAIGSFTYGLPAPVNKYNPPVTMNTTYDMASLTKVLMTTSALMTFYERGEITLDLQISDRLLLGSGFSQNGKGDITILNLLLHNAGFPPDPVPGYSTPEFGCPESNVSDPLEDFSCRGKIFDSLLQQTLINPPGETFVYSDLSMITAAFVVGRLAKFLSYVEQSDLDPECIAGGDLGDPALDQCYYLAYVKKFIMNPLQMSSSYFNPPISVWDQIAPTWNDTDYRHRVLQGQVSDENSYALGGIAGHAGLFSTAGDVSKLISGLMWPSTSIDDHFLNKTTIDVFTKIFNTSQSSRALGWDTNDYNLNLYRGCGNLSETTFTHTGYTGTQVCCDPERNIYTILLTNRCYPVKEALSEIHIARQQFNNAVKEVVDENIHTIRAARSQQRRKARRRN